MIFDASKPGVSMAKIITVELIAFIAVCIGLAMTY
jgi:hypothetical protein